MSLNNVIESAAWRTVPDEVVRLATKAAGAYRVIQDLIAELPDIGASVWYNPDTRTVKFAVAANSDSDKVASWHIAMKQVPDVDVVEHGPDIELPAQEPYMYIKRATEVKDVLGPIASAAQFKPNALNRL